MGKPVVHFDIGCRNAEKTRDFYAKLFDWSAEPYGGNSFKFHTGSDKGIQGHATALGHEPHNYVLFYVEVEDIQAYLDRAEALGGKVKIPPLPVPGGGTFAWFTDPDGNLVGLLKQP